MGNILIELHFLSARLDFSHFEMNFMTFGKHFFEYENFQLVSIEWLFCSL